MFIWMANSILLVMMEICFIAELARAWESMWSHPATLNNADTGTEMLIYPG